MYSNFNLQMFAEGSMGPVAGDSGVSEVSDVSAGASAAEGTDVSQNPPGMDDGETFESLIKGRYKDEYNAAVKDAVSKRFKNQKDLQGKIDKMNPLIGMFAERYNVAPGPNGEIDLEALTDRIQNDNSMYEEEAFKRGMDVETLKEMKRLERENAYLQSQQQANLEEAQRRKEFDELMAQGNELKQFYPDFDLGTELNNSDFGRLLASGVPLKTAYEVVHKDEILAGGMQYAVQHTAENISRSIQSGMSRPAENGLTPKAPADVSRIDPGKMTLAQINEIKERVMNGEKIAF